MSEPVISQGWRQRLTALRVSHLVALSVVSALVMTEAIVSALALVFGREITWDYLATGAIAAGLVSLLVTSLLVHFLEEIRENLRLTGEIEERKRIEANLIEAMHAVEVANEAKGLFLATISHELRTPLNAIIGYSEILLEDDVIRADEDLQTDLNQILRSGDVLLKMISGILEITRIGSDEVLVEEIEVQALLRALVAELHRHVQAQYNTLHLAVQDDLGTLHTDPEKLQTCLRCLLDNAGKFTEYGTIDVAVWDEDEWCHFRIRDTGIGMCEEDLPIIFDVFTQADASSTRRHGGVGLGLAIAKANAELIGGQISVSSTLGEGATFTLRIPSRLHAADG